MTLNSIRKGRYLLEIDVEERRLTPHSAAADELCLSPVEPDGPVELVSQDVQDHVIDEVVASLNEMQALSTLDLSLRTGRLIMERFYQGDPSRWRHHGDKEVSFRKLANRCRRDLRVSASYLYRAVALYELVTRIGFEWEARLSTTHLRSVLGLPSAKQAALLKAAQDEAWSSARLEEESARVRATLEHRSGRPPVPPMLRAVRKLTATWHKLESAADSVELEALSTTQVQAASRAIAELRERMDRLARRLVSDDTPDAASSAASLDRTH